MFVGLGVGWWSVWVDVGVVDFVQCEVWGSLFRCGDVGDGKGGRVWGDMWGLTVRKRGNVYSERHTVVSCLVGSYAAQSTVVEMSLIIPTPAQSYRESYKHLRRRKTERQSLPFPDSHPCVVMCTHACLPPNTLLSHANNECPSLWMAKATRSVLRRISPTNTIHPLPSQPTQMHVSPAQRRPKVPSQNTPNPLPLCL